MNDTTNKHLEQKRNPQTTESFVIEKTAEKNKDTETNLNTEINIEDENSKIYPKTNKQAKQKKGLHIPKPARDKIVLQIEKIMEEDLSGAYNQLSPIAKQEFKIKGEKTANNIRELMKATHLKVKKIFKLIFEWLKILPGANRFFLEQEAKVKTDKIIILHKTGKKL